MTDGNDLDDARIVINGIEDSVFADTQTIILSTAQLLRSLGSWFTFQLEDRLCHSLERRTFKPIHFLFG